MDNTQETEQSETSETPIARETPIASAPLPFPDVQLTWEGKDTREAFLELFEA